MGAAGRAAPAELWGKSVGREGTPKLLWTPRSMWAGGECGVSSACLWAAAAEHPGSTSPRGSRLAGLHQSLPL